MSDYHLHLHKHVGSGSSHPDDVEQGTYPQGHIERYVERAAANGVLELGFTEHLYRCHEAAPVLGEFWQKGDTDADLAELSRQMVENDRTLSLEDYVVAISDAKDRGLPVLLGLEIDFFPDTIGAVLDLIAPYPWDYLIGSVHWVGGWAIDAEHSVAGFERRGVDQAWEVYFELETQLAASGAVDVLAHVDLPKKYGYRPTRERTDLYDSVVAAAASSNTAVEVSSQGLRNPAAEVYPAPAFLQRFQAADVPITLASDGHHPDQAGMDNDQVVAAARQGGYGERLRFDRRRRSMVPL